MAYTEEDIRKYSRLWDEVVREANPKLWERGVELLKQTPLWHEVASDPEFREATDDEVASEAKSILCSQRGRRIFDEMKHECVEKDDFKQWLVWSKLEKWLGRFWNFIGSWLHDKAATQAAMTGREVKDVTLEEIVDKTVLDYVASQEHTSPNRVEICTSLPYIKSRYGDLHRRAKAGDDEAANRLVAAVANPEKFRHLSVDHPSALLLPIIADEATGHNKIPAQFAAFISKASGLETCTDIYQSVRTRHTGATKMERFLRIPEFSGHVERGREYVIVDDHCTQGATLNALRQHVMKNGGYVVGYATLSASAGGTMPEISQGELESLRKADVGGRMESLMVEKYGYPRGLEDMTHGQARFLLVMANFESVLEELDSNNGIRIR